MSNTKDLMRKKLFGTAIFALFALGVALSASSIVQALFYDSETTFIVDGMVESITEGSVTVGITGSTNTITIDIGSNTAFSPLGFSPVSGNLIRVTAVKRIGPTALALLIQPVGDGFGYGAPGNNVSITKGLVTSIGSDTFNVSTGSAAVTFKVQSSTMFIYNGGIVSFANLASGNRVFVQGVDNGTEFIATSVIINSL